MSVKWKANALNSKYAKKIKALIRGDASDAFAKAMTALDLAALALQDFSKTPMNERRDDRMQALRRIRSLAWAIDQEGEDPEQWETEPLPEPPPGSMLAVAADALKEVGKQSPELSDARERAMVELMLQIIANDCWPSDMPLGGTTD